MRSALQMKLDMAVRSISTAVIIRCSLWLPFLGIPKEVQTVVEGLPFESDKLFSAKTDESLHSLKVS